MRTILKLAKQWHYPAVCYKIFCSVIVLLAICILNPLSSGFKYTFRTSSDILLTFLLQHFFSPNFPPQLFTVNVCTMWLENIQTTLNTPPNPEHILWFGGCNNMSSRATMKLQISWSKNFQHSAEMWSILEGIWKLKNVSDLRKALSSLRRFNSFSRSGTFATSALTVFTMAMSCSWRARRRSNSCHSAKREISRKK